MEEGTVGLRAIEDDTASSAWRARASEWAELIWTPAERGTTSDMSLARVVLTDVLTSRTASLRDPSCWRAASLPRVRDVPLSDASRALVRAGPVDDDAVTSSSSGESERKWCLEVSGGS